MSLSPFYKNMPYVTRNFFLSLGVERGQCDLDIFAKMAFNAQPTKHQFAKVDFPGIEYPVNNLYTSRDFRFPHILAYLELELGYSCTPKGWITLPVHEGKKPLDDDLRLYGHPAHFSPSQRPVLDSIGCYSQVAVPYFYSWDSYWGLSSPL